MADLISREALLAEYDRVHVGEPGGARKLISEAPAVDAEPVRHGRWEWKDGAAYCTAHKGKLSPHTYGYGYCPMCGAKMDGGKQNEHAKED